MSLLFYAILKGHRKVVNLLLQYGAEVDMVDSVGVIPLTVALSSGYQAIAQMLKAHNSKILLARAPLGGRAKEIALLMLQNGIRVGL